MTATVSIFGNSITQAKIEVNELMNMRVSGLMKHSLYRPRELTVSK